MVVYRDLAGVSPGRIQDSEFGIQNWNPELTQFFMIHRVGVLSPLCFHFLLYLTVPPCNTLLEVVSCCCFFLFSVDTILGGGVMTGIIVLYKRGRIFCCLNVENNRQLVSFFCRIHYVFIVKTEDTTVPTRQVIDLVTHPLNQIICVKPVVFLSVSF